MTGSLAAERRFTDVGWLLHPISREWAGATSKSGGSGPVTTRLCGEGLAGVFHLVLPHRTRAVASGGYSLKSEQNINSKHQPSSLSSSPNKTSTQNTNSHLSLYLRHQKHKHQKQAHEYDLRFGIKTRTLHLHQSNLLTGLLLFN